MGGAIWSFRGLPSLVQSSSEGGAPRRSNSGKDGEVGSVSLDEDLAEKMGSLSLPKPKAKAKPKLRVAHA